jgi:hypothetical protein
MGLLDSLKGMFGKNGASAGTSREIPGLPTEMDTVEEMKDKLQETVGDNVVEKITGAIPGEMDDKLADQLLGKDNKQE